MGWFDGKKEEKGIPLSLPGLTFPMGAELEHILISATTGSGKSQLIHYLLDSILKGIAARPESQRAIITDLNGQFAESRSHPQDHLVNPSDKRSLKWNPFREIKTEMDYKLLSTSAITTDGASGEEKNWRQFAQTMLESIMKGLDKEGNPNPQRVLELIRPSDPELVRQYITGTPAESLLSGPNERFFGSVIGVLSNALSAWEFLEPDGGFSIRDWVWEGKGCLFLIYTPAQIEAMRPLLGCWLSLAIRETLSLPIEVDKNGVPTRRIWFITDELDSLGTIHGMGEALSQGRKMGLSVISAIQTLAQLRIRYGPDGSAALLACFVNKLIMKQGDFADAKHWSDYLGQQEVERIVRNEGGSKGGNGGAGESFGRHAQREIRQLVLPSELQDLPKFCGYARISGQSGVSKFRFEPRGLPKVAEPFIPKQKKY